MTEELNEKKEELKPENQEPEKKEENKDLENKTLKLKEEPKFEIIDGIKYPKELIREAKIQGWRQREDFKGDNKNYLPPDEFVERGEVLPALLKKKIAYKDKKLEKLDEDNKILKDLLEKQLKFQVIDKIEKIDDKMQEASDLGETKKISDLTRKKIELERQLEELKKEEINKEIPQAPQIPQTQQRPQEIIDWELKNPWSLDKTNPESISRTNIANNIFNRINADVRNENLNLSQRLALLDYNLKDYEEKNHQRKNLNPPIGQNKNISEISKTARNISNLIPSVRKEFEKHCYDTSGNRFTGKQLKIYEESFLNGCEDSHFNK